MKLELPTQKLKEAISLSERVSGKHAALPVLSCVLVEVAKNSVVFKATNLDIGIEVNVPAKTNDSGSLAIPAHIISSFISQLPEQNGVISMESTSGNLLITSSKSKGVIKTVPPDDFPTIPSVVDGASIPMQTELFIKGLKSVWYSASVSSVKPELSSVYIYQDGDSMVFAATDSFRLAEKKLKAPSSAKIGEILIPFKNVADIIRILESMGTNVDVKISKNLISFESDGIRMVSRVIDGVFPDYRQIIPKGYLTEVVVLKQDILNALKISNIFSDKFNQIKMIVDPKKKHFEIHTKNSDVGENETAIDAALTGEPLEVNFNYKYIADCFQSIDADSVSMQFSGLNRPLVIRPISGDQTFMYIAMPMNR